MASDPARSHAILERLKTDDPCRTTTHGQRCHRPATHWVSAPNILKHRCCEYHARVWAANAYTDGVVVIDPPLEENADAHVQAKTG